MRKRGITILEIMVAISLFLLIVLPLARIFTTGLGVVQQTEDYLLATQLVNERLKQAEQLYSTMYRGGVVMDFDGCAGRPFTIDYSSFPPIPTIPTPPRVQDTSTGGPNWGEPRPSGECPDLGTPPPALPPAFGVFYDDHVYIQLDARNLPSTHDPALNQINTGLTQSQIALAVIAARLDPLDAMAIYYNLPWLDRGARIDGIEDFGEILDRSLLEDIGNLAPGLQPVSLPNPGYPTCTGIADASDTSWFEFGYRRTVCHPETPGTSIPGGELVFAPRLLCQTGTDCTPGSGGRLDLALRNIERARVTYQRYMRQTEVTSVFYLDSQRVPAAPFDCDATLFPCWWSYFFRSETPNDWDPLRFRDRVYGRLIRVTVMWKTGRRVPDPTSPGTRAVEEVKRVQETRFVPAPPCDSAYDFIDTSSPVPLGEDGHYYLDPFQPHGATAPWTRTNLQHNRETLYLEYQYDGPGANLPRLRLDDPDHWISPQCGNTRP
ncbi:MAG: type IV pilus modification PilV family protein [bacterium JZ-2024 1]